MAVIVELRFDLNTKPFFADATNFELKKGDRVVADYSDCRCVATVVSENVEEETAKELTKIHKKFDEQDQKTFDLVLEKSKQSFKKVQEAIQKFELGMKLVDVKHSFDQTKLFVSYSADARVDFRDLVKYLASIFKTRVELRQISSREEAKMLAGCGVCGRPFCCATFLKDSPQVSIKMAKTQGLALNPTKVNGACGKLLCCIAYENEEYQKVLEKLPPLGSTVETTKGKGEVIFQDLVKETFSIKVFEDEQTFSILECTLEDLKEN